VRLPALVGCYPVMIGPRGILPNVLTVTTLEFSYPIQIFVQMKSDDFLWFALKLSLRLHYTLLTCDLPENETQWEIKVSENQ
jgi:hypothetical protein